MEKKIPLILCACICLMSLCSCKQNVYPLTTTQFMMDTVITITIYDGDSDALDGAVKLCQSYERLLSKTVEESDIARINNSNGELVEVSAETVALLNTALDISRKSDGAFDPTVFPLVELWNVTGSATVPSADRIAKALETVDYNNISVNGTTVTAANGAKLDLGGIAKGYIADRVKEYLKSKGVTGAVINLGGNTLLLGNKSGAEFSVGIQKPFGAGGELSAVIMLEDKTAVTSGVYQRYFESGGKLYHHIIDTKTGYPTDNELYSVTVIADSSAIADGLSTACLSLGIDKGTELARQYGAELIFITSDGELLLTDGLEKTESDGSVVIKLK